MKRPERLSGALLYLVGTQVLFLTVRVTVIRVIGGGPGQSAIPLPEITDRNVPGNLHSVEDETESSCWLLDELSISGCAHFVSIVFFHTIIHKTKLRYVEKKTLLTLVQCINSIS